MFKWMLAGETAGNRVAVVVTTVPRVRPALLKGGGVALTGMIGCRRHCLHRPL